MPEIKYQQSSDVPTQKVQAGTIGAAIATLVVWAFRQYVGIIFPPLAEAAITVLFTAAATFASGYFTRPARRDHIEETNNV